MKNIFMSSFLPQRNYWMGQITPPTSDALQNALSAYNQAQTWLAGTPNPSAWLGPDWIRFQTANAEAQSLYGDVSGFGEILTTGGTLSDAQSTEANTFVNDAQIVSAIIGMHPASANPAAAGGTPAATSGGTAGNTAAQAITAAGQAASQIIKATTPPVKPVVVPPAAAPDLTTPLLIGGGITVALIVVLIATR